MLSTLLISPTWENLAVAGIFLENIGNKNMINKSKAIINFIFDKYFKYIDRNIASTKNEKSKYAE